MRQLLDDVVVVEISEEPAAAFCGKAFADLGADVIKIEPASGDRLRNYRGMFLNLNTNKRSLVIDASERERLLDVISRAHMVIESLGWGDLGGRGLDVELLREDLPSLVVVSISGFGATGPYAGYRWTDLVGQAAAWATLPPAYAHEPSPVKLPGIAGLCLLGQTAALGALAAVLRASATGHGARVDCAMCEALGTVPSRASRWLGWQYNGKKPMVVLSARASNVLLPNGIFPCRDGYVSLQVTPQQLPAMLKVLDDDCLAEAFAHPDAYVRGETKELLDAVLFPWLLSQTRDELTAAAQSSGWPLAGVMTPSEVLEADHLHQRSYWIHCDSPDSDSLLMPGPPYRHSEGGWRIRHPAPRLDQHHTDDLPESRQFVPWHGPPDPMEPPLRGIRCLDFTAVWSGPYATQLLADLGAEVIRVENPSVFPPSTKGYEPRPNTKMIFSGLLAGYATPLPGRPDRPYNRHSMNNSVSRNKLSCSLDPRRPEGRDLFLQLVERSDVLIENLKVSALHHMGIQEGDLLERNPRLIVIRVPCAGLTGDWAGYKGLGAQFDALSGLAWLSGHHSDELFDAPPAIYMDAATGPAAAFAIVAALHYRDSTGRGQMIELSQLENVIGHLGDIFLDLQLGVPPQRLGNRDRYWAPQGIYPCDGEFRWLALSVTSDAEWLALASVIGGEGLSDDPQYRRNEDRLARQDELDELLAKWTAGRDVVEAFHLLQAAGIPASPVMFDDLLDSDAHIAHRGWLRPLHSTDVGAYPHVGHALRGIPQAWDRGSPILGEDNRYVYQEILGLDDAAYAVLVERRIVVEDYLDSSLNPI
jgi:crotonobetainyl-CoA:carnitine CoA-transferase CaiB-like acyl-CoA transferase